MSTSDSSPTSPVVIYRIGSLGDTITALPCFNEIAAAYPDRPRLVLTNVPVSSKAAPLMAVLGPEAGIVHGAISYPVGTRSPVALLRLWLTLRRLKTKTLVYLMPNRSFVAAWRDWLYFKSIGIKEIHGFPHSAKLRQNLVESDGRLEPESFRLARCLSPRFSVRLDERRSWDLHLTRQELAVGENAVSALSSTPYIAFNIGGKAAQKDWGQHRWLQLFSILKETFPHLGLLAVGGDEDRQRSEELLSQWPGPVVNACGLPPRESAAAMREAALFVGHDSGPMHLAASIDIACIGLFGELTQPRKWHPIGSKVTVIHERTGMSAITVESVVAAIMPHLLQPTDARQSVHDSSA